METKEPKREASSAPTVEEANTCIAIGAGVGALGLAGTTLLAATCPICYVAAPALIATGLIAKRRAKKNQDEERILSQEIATTATQPRNDK